jgi:colicin import membrane protein
MAGKRLKVFQAHMGFYDTVVAAPSQKAALEAWGAGQGEFAKGFARVTSEPAAVKSALAHPGQVLRRPFGSKGDFKRDADPVPPPKISPKDDRAVRERRKKAALAQRKAAERELREAEAEAATARAALKQRQTELAREKAAAESKARDRIARAKARLKK